MALESHYTSIAKEYLPGLQEQIYGVPESEDGEQACIRDVWERASEESLSDSGISSVLQDGGNHYIPTYLPVVQRRRDIEFRERQRDFQFYHRERYVEFNLVYDRRSS